jgi:hypothetical protein
MTFFVQIFPIIIISIVLFSVGVWEATVASSNQNTSSLTDNEKEAYAFTVIKSIMNIINSLTIYCLMCKNDKDDKDTKTNKSNEFSLINIGINIWGLVMYDIMSSNNNLFGNFSQVIYAEMIIFTTACSIIGFGLIFSCCIIFTSKSNTDTTTKMPTDIIQIPVATIVQMPPHTIININ